MSQGSVEIVISDHDRELAGLSSPDRAGTEALGYRRRLNSTDVQCSAGWTGIGNTHAVASRS